MAVHYYGLVPADGGFRPVFADYLIREFERIGAADVRNPTVAEWVAATEKKHGIVAVADGLLHSGGKVVWVRPTAADTIRSFRAAALKAVEDSFAEQLAAVGG